MELTETIDNVVFVKAGGSFITYKDKPFTINYTALSRLVDILRNSVKHVRILLGNGGGSFAHPVVKMLKDSDPLKLLVHCQKATRLLNKIIVDYLVDHGIDAVSLQTSAFIVEEKGFSSWLKPLKLLLKYGVIPVVYGECIISSSSIYHVLSTEDVFALISSEVKPVRIVLLTDVDGVYTCNPYTCRDAELIKEISNKNYNEILDMIEGSGGIDVTGGIRSKVEKMMNISKKLGVPVIIVSGHNVSEAVSAITKGVVSRGTVIKGF